jgi:glutamate formiminotransferase
MPDPSQPHRLLAVPNISEGRSTAALEAIAAAFTRHGRATLLDAHSDEDHHRAVFTLTGEPGALAQALLQGVAEAVHLVGVDLGDGHAGPRRGEADLEGAAGEGRRPGQHPHVGAADVVPIVYLDAHARGAACAEALVVADRIGTELGVPVFLYGELTGSQGGIPAGAGLPTGAGGAGLLTGAGLTGAGLAGGERGPVAGKRQPLRTRAELRRGGLRGLAERMAAGEQRPDFGPPALHPTAGATLVAAREPLVAFNLELAPPAGIAKARAIAALIREGGEEGLSGLKAIGVALRQGTVAQVSMNVERPLELSLAQVLEAVARHAEVAAAEIVGLTPRAALEDFPANVPIRGFDPARQVIENALSL